MSLPSSLDIRLLDALVALIDEASVTKAAQRVGMTQPRMSDALARLRVITGDPLLVRSGARLVPTDRAIEITAGVRLSLAGLHRAMEQPENFEPYTSTRGFILAMSDYLSSMLLPGIMAELEAAAPRITIRIKTIEPQQIDRWLDAEECHIAFGVLNHLNERLRASVLMHNYPVCIARKNQFDSGITLEQFLQHGHVLTSGTPGPISTLEQIIDAALAQHGHVRRIAAAASSGFALAATVSQTNLIATLPVDAAATYAQSLPLQLLKMPLRVTPFPVTMVWHERMHRDPGHLWLRRVMRTIARRLTVPER